MNNCDHLSLSRHPFQRLPGLPGQTHLCCCRARVSVGHSWCDVCTNPCEPNTEKRSTTADASFPVISSSEHGASEGAESAHISDSWQIDWINQHNMWARPSQRAAHRCTLHGCVPPLLLACWLMKHIRVMKAVALALASNNKQRHHAWLTCGT